MNRLVLDARCLASGIATYGLNLIARLAEEKAAEGFSVIALPRMEAKIRKYCPSVQVLDVPIYSAQEQWSVPRAVPSGSVLHALHYNAPIAFRGPMIVTIHDLTHVRAQAYRNHWKSWVYARPVLRMVARRAEHIVTGSQYVKRCIVEALGVPDSKISIASYGIESEFVPGDKSQARASIAGHFPSNRPYILFVGNLKPHKNVSGLVAAYSALKKSRRIDHSLVLVGDDERHRELLLRSIKSQGIENDVIVIRSLPRPDLISFYQAADLLVLPSFEEGFGLPIAEAMACGIPVACSRAAAMPEVGGNAVEYFDPYSREEIANAIEKVIASREKQTEMITAGLVQASKFTWDYTFQVHKNVYRSVVAGASA